MTQGRAIVPLLGILLAACGRPVVVHAPDASPKPAPLHLVEAELTQHSVVADGIDVYATLWDAALVTATDPDRPSNDAAVEAEQQRWRAQYLADQTSFTIAFDIAERPPIARKGDDPLTDLSKWDFALERGERPAQAATRVELIGIDRFPTRRGEHHHRIVARVHFEGSLHASLPTSAQPSEIRLLIRSRAKLWKRPALGLHAANRGISLRWKVTSG